MTDGLAKEKIAKSARRRLSVRHETVYRYQGAASLGYSLAWLTPRPLPTQDLREHRLNVFPKPRFLHESFDAFGNVQHYFEVHKGHSELRIQSQAVVECAEAPDLGVLSQPWETFCIEHRGRGGDVVGADGDPAAWDFVYPSELVPQTDAYTDYARQSFTPGRPLGEALLAFNAQIHRDFQYLPGATDVDTPLAEVWEQRAGVCQDFAHFAVSCLRGLGLASAYISGYLLTYPLPGETKRIGADASHAWFAVWAGAEHGWVQLDPTNDLVVGDEHIVVAIGRDYSDTPPVKGVCFGGGHHQLSVAVTVEQLPNA
jgi:transglutaminase-like putative cysteine protease